MVYTQKPEIGDFCAFGPDLGQNRRFWPLPSKRQVVPGKSKNFQTFPHGKIFLWVPIRRIFSALQSGEAQFPALRNLKITKFKIPQNPPFHF